MSKKGVSPIVATVLLIVIVVVLAAIIFLWAKGFLSESATKGDKIVEASCEDIRFEAQVVNGVSECNANEAALDINNIGNIPIYGVQVLRYDDSTGSIDRVPLVDQPFSGGTVKIGGSAFACLGITVSSGDKFRVIPKLLAEKEERKITYTCPEKDGITITYIN